MSNIIYYVYWILNIRTLKSYIGKRHTNEQNPYDDIGVKYFSSSSDKDFINNQKEHPENYQYFVLSVFDNDKDASLEENRLHKLFFVNKNIAFYNKSINPDNYGDYTGIVTLYGESHPNYNKQMFHNPQTGEHRWCDQNNIPNGFVYGFSKKTLKQKSIAMTGKMNKENNPNYNKNFYHNPLTKKGGFYTDDTVPDGWIKGNTKETIQLKASVSLGRKCSDEMKQKLSETKTNLFLMYKGDSNEYVPKEYQLEKLKDGWLFKGYRGNWMQSPNGDVCGIPEYLIESLLQLNWTPFSKREYANKKHSEWMTGRKMSDDYRIKHCIGSTNPNYGNRKMRLGDNEIRCKDKFIDRLNEGYRFTKKQPNDVYLVKSNEKIFVPETIVNECIKNGWSILTNDNKPKIMVKKQHKPSYELRKKYTRVMIKNGNTKNIEKSEQLHYFNDGWRYKGHNNQLDWFVTNGIEITRVPIFIIPKLDSIWIICHKPLKTKMSPDELHHYRSEKLKKRWTKENREKLSDMMSGEKNPFYGKKHLDETKKKLSEHKKQLNAVNNPYTGMRKMIKDGVTKMIPKEKQLDMLYDGWYFTYQHRDDIMMYKDGNKIRVPEHTKQYFIEQEFIEEK